jgi:hypothetical protein
MSRPAATRSVPRAPWIHLYTYPTTSWEVRHPGEVASQIANDLPEEVTFRPNPVKELLQEIACWRNRSTG